MDLPDGVSEIGGYAFEGCCGLRELTLPSSTTLIKGYTFSGCSSLSSLIVPNGVTTIKGYAFYGCAGLVSLSLPDSLTNFSNAAVWACPALKRIDVGNGNQEYTSIDGILFAKDLNTLICCPEATSGHFEIPSTVTVIADGAFWGCQNIDTIGIAESVTNIEKQAFYNCVGLTTLFIPKHITNVAERICFGCSNLISVSLSPNTTVIGPQAFSRCERLMSVSIPQGVQEIGNHAFSGCSTLEEVVIPDSVVHMGNAVFRDCICLSSLIISENVENISPYLCQNCCKLTSINISANVTNIDKTAFWECRGLTNINVDLNNLAYVSREGVLYSKDEKILKLVPPGQRGTYIVPFGVETIGENAFDECKELTNIDIPNSVTTIGDSAYYGCSGLKRLVIPDSVIQIGNWAFYKCDGLVKLYVPAAWEGTQLLQNTAIPSGCTVVYGEPEADVTSMTPVAVPYSWLEEYATEILESTGGNYDAAANSNAANGIPVWQCYLAGLSPTDTEAEFQVKSVSIVNGEVIIEWDPDLNDNGTKMARHYTLLGKRLLTDGDWSEIPSDADMDAEGWRFFRVRVGLP